VNATQPVPRDQPERRRDGGDLTVDLRGCLAVAIVSSVGIGHAVAIGLACRGRSGLCSASRRQLGGKRQLIGDGLSLKRLRDRAPQQYDPPGADARHNNWSKCERDDGHGECH